MYPIPGQEGPASRNKNGIQPPLPHLGVRKPVGQVWEHWCSFIGQTDSHHPNSALTSHYTVRAH